MTRERWQKSDQSFLEKSRSWLWHSEQWVWGCQQKKSHNIISFLKKSAGQIEKVGKIICESGITHMCNIFSASSRVTAQILWILPKYKMCCQEIEKSKCETMTNYFRSKMIVFDTWKQWTQKKNCENCKTRGMCNNLEWRSNGENFTSKTIHHHQTTTQWKQKNKK